MIAISQIYPHDTAPEDSIRNQVMAHQSWEKTFEKIYYMDDVEPALAGPTTVFLPGFGRYPKLVDVAALCAQQPEWCWILNADILLVPDRFTRVADRLLKAKAIAAESFSYEVTADHPERIPSTRSGGMKVVGGTRDFWLGVNRDCPTHLQLGACAWDNWMAGYFGAAPHSFYDITESRAILHLAHSYHGWLHVIPGPCDMDPRKNSYFNVKPRCLDPIDCT